MIFIQIYNGSHENNMEMRVMEKMPQHCSWFDVRAALARLTAKFKGEEEQDDNVDLHDEKKIMMKLCARSFEMDKAAG